jgi:hypothetical protein
VLYKLRRAGSGDPFPHVINFRCERRQTPADDIALSPSDPPRMIDPDPHRTGGIAATLDIPSVDHENRVTHVRRWLRELARQQLEGLRNSNKSGARDEISTVDDHAGAPSN